MSFFINKILFRNIIKNRYNWINIFGLTISTAVFISIFLFIQNEYSFEKHHKNLNSIYRVEQFQKDGEKIQNLCGAPPPLSLVITEDIPEVKSTTRYVKNEGALIELPDGSKISEEDIIFADKSFFEIFSYPVVYGNPIDNLDQPYMAVITEELAHKYFGSEKAVGKILKYNNGFDIEIQAVVKQLSKNSHLNFNIFISFNTILSLNGPEIVTDDWFSNWTIHYVLINKNSSIENLNATLENYLQKYQGEQSENTLYLKPLKDIHLKSTVTDETAQVGNVQTVTIFSIIAILILVVACINYINLATAYSAIRGKEVGIRKVNGANQIGLVMKFLGESFFIVVISLFLAVILSEFMISYFNYLIDRNLEINLLTNRPLIILFVFLCFSLTLLTGIYPAIILSKFKAVDVLKKSYFGANRKSYFRRILVVFQFFISVALIISTIFLLKQLSFLKNKDLGYNKEQVVIIYLTNNSNQKFQQFRNELEVKSDIKLISTSDYLPMNSSNWTGFSWENALEDDYLRMNINYIDPNFVNVYDIQIQSGSGFTEELTNQEQLYVLLNQKAIKEIGWEDDVIGKKIVWSVDYRTRNPKEAIIAGVVEDFHYLSKHHEISPMIMPLMNQESIGSIISVKLTSEYNKESLANIETVFNEIYNDEMWNYQFADEVVQGQYNNESKMSQLIAFFTLIAIVIGIMGLYGLISFTTNQRVKEIGIRKVLGANMSSLVYTISREFIIMLIIANIIAWPITYIQVSNWLQNFEYHIEINLYVFFIGTLLSLLIAFLAVGVKIIKSSMKNPVDALRYE